MAYEYRTGTFQAHDGLALFFQCWIANPDQPERSLVIHHGLGEHSGRYQPVVDAFDGESVNIFTFDARGHGRSPGKRGDIRRFLDLVNDLECFFEFLKDEFGVVRPILLGHSMGGLVALGFTVHHSNQWHIRAVVTSGAALRPHLDFSQKIKTEVGKILHAFSPGLTLPTGLPPTYLSHDPSVAEDYDRDPLTHSVISIRMALSLMHAGEDVLARATKLKIPVFITHGDADPIVDVNGSLEFYQRCVSKDRDLQLYPGLFHEIYNETPAERERVLSDLRRWVVEHLPEAQKMPDEAAVLTETMKKS